MRNEPLVVCSNVTCRRWNHGQSCTRRRKTSHLQATCIYILQKTAYSKPVMKIYQYKPSHSHENYSTWYGDEKHNMDQFIASQMSTDTKAQPTGSPDLNRLKAENGGRGCNGVSESLRVPLQRISLHAKDYTVNSIFMDIILPFCVSLLLNSYAVVLLWWFKWPDNYTMQNTVKQHCRIDLIYNRNLMLYICLHVSQKETTV